MCDKHNPRSPGNGADWYCTCTYVADHNGPHRCTCGFQWPTPPIEPEAEPLTDREPTVNEVAMLATIDRLTRERDEAVDSEQRVTAHRDLLYERFAAAESCALAAEAERDRYREALESIANPYVHDAEAQTWIAQHALDGEG